MSSTINTGGNGRAPLLLLRLLWSKHRVALAIGAILLLVFVLAPAQGVASIQFVADALLGVAPFLLLSIAIAGYAIASGADNLIARAFTGSPVAMILFAAALGGLSPFCSCGVIPLIAALLAMGVPLAGVMAFWLASPVIDPASFVLTTGLLGFEFAIAKTVAAISLGLFGGFMTLLLTRTGQLQKPLRPEVSSSSSSGGCAGSTVSQPSEIVWQFWRVPSRRQKFVSECLSTAVFLLKWMTLAFLLESLMLAYVPAQWIASALGGSGVMPILTATFVGVPAYLNGFAALPLVSGLMEQGMLPGAGLAFLVAGGVTSLPAAIAVYALVKFRVFMLYIAFALCGSLASGLLYQGYQLWTN